MDVARMGAAGVYSRLSVFEEDAEPGEVFVPNDADAWTEVIIRLIDDPVFRAQASCATQIAVERLESIPACLPGLSQFG
jgi:hypothetical protein